MPLRLLQAVTLKDILEALPKEAALFNLPSASPLGAGASAVASEASEASEMGTVSASAGSEPPSISSDDASISDLSDSDDDIPIKSSLPLPSALPAVGTTHFMMQLGTDTAYKHERLAPDIREIDPLSHTAQIISQILGEGRDGDFAFDKLTQTGNERCKRPRGLAYQSASVTVINGPETLARNVGDRIAESVLTALHAIARGKHNLCFAAHSRGAVESILIMHELSRIKRELNESNKSLRSILLNSPDAATNRAMKAFIGVAGSADETALDTPEMRAKFKAQIDNLSLSAFLIDPVPGNAPNFVPNALDYITWSDERFRQDLPPEVKHCQVFICNDERSQAFRPLVPRGIAASNEAGSVRRDIFPTIIPGNHGSMMGNPNAQGDVKVGGMESDRLKVRDFIACRLLNFLQDATGLFNQDQVDMPLRPVLGGEVVDEIINNFRKANNVKARRDQLIALSRGALGVQDWAKIFRKTSYMPGALVEGPDIDLGRVLANFAKSVGDLTLGQLPLSMLMDEVSALMLGDLDQEHFAPIFQLSPLEQVDNLGVLLKKLIDELTQYKPGITNIALTLANAYMGPSRVAILDRVSSLIDRIAQNYFASDMFKNGSQRDAFVDAIIVLFDLLKAGPLPDSFVSIPKLFAARLTHHVKERALIIVDGMDVLKKKIESFLTNQAEFYDFHVRRQAYLDEAPPNEPADIVAVYQKVKAALIASLNRETVEDLPGLMERLVHAEAGLTEVQQHALLQLFKESKCFVALASTDTKRIESLLVDLQGLNERVDSFVASEPKLRQIVPGMQVDVANINTLRDELQSLTAKMLADKQSTYDIRHKPDYVTAVLYKAIQAHAIKDYNARSPELLASIDSANQQMAEQIEGQDRNVTQLAVQLDALQKLQEERHVVESQVQAMLTEIKALAARSILSHAATLKGKFAEVDTKLRELEEKKAAWSSRAQELTQSSNLLLEAIERLDSQEGVTLRQQDTRATLMQRKAELVQKALAQHARCEAVQAGIAADSFVRENAAILEETKLQLIVAEPAELMAKLQAQKASLNQLDVRKGELAHKIIALTSKLAELQTAVSSTDLQDRMTALSEFSSLKEELAALTTEVDMIHNQQQMVVELFRNRLAQDADIERDIQLKEQSAAITDLINDMKQWSTLVDELQKGQQQYTTQLEAINTANATDEGQIRVDVVERLKTLTTVYRQHLASKDVGEPNESLKAKIAVVDDLLKTLNNPWHTAEQQAQAFKTCLMDDKNRAVLSYRRDPAFKVFFEGVLDVCLAVVTGILPYVIYNAVSHGTLRFFSRAKGDTFVEESLSIAKTVDIKGALQEKKAGPDEDNDLGSKPTL